MLPNPDPTAETAMVRAPVRTIQDSGPSTEREARPPALLAVLTGRQFLLFSAIMIAGLCYVASCGVDSTTLLVIAGAAYKLVDHVRMAR